MWSGRSPRSRPSSGRRSGTSRSRSRTSTPTIPTSSGSTKAYRCRSAGDWAGAIPDRIRIFRLPLVESFPDPAELEREIRITVLHELAHYFGLDEDRLDELGFS
jgi:hypothetical protein